MDRINHSTAIDLSPGKKGFRSKDTVNGIPGTVLTASFLNGAQEELVGVIEKTGIAANAADFTQLARAIRSGWLNFKPLGGTANALTMTLDPAPAAWAELVGVPLRGIVASANTGAVTLTITGLGAKAVVRGIDGGALTAGDLRLGGVVEFIYDGTAFQLLAARGLTAHNHDGYHAILGGNVFTALQDIKVAGTNGTSRYHLRLQQADGVIRAALGLDTIDVPQIAVHNAVGTWTSSYSFKADGNLASTQGGIYWNAANFDPATKQNALGFTPVRQGGGPSQGSNQINIGYAVDGLRAAVDGAHYGVFAMKGAHTHLWAEITDKPSTFPPDAHNHNGYHAVLGSNVFTALQDIKVAGANATSRHHLRLQQSDGAVRGAIGLGATDVPQLGVHNAAGAEVSNYSFKADGNLSSTQGGIFWNATNFDPALKQNLLGYTPVRQGGGPGQGANQINIGYGSDGIRVAVDSTHYATMARVDGLNTFQATQDIKMSTANGTARYYARLLQATGEIRGALGLDATEAPMIGVHNAAGGFASAFILRADGDLTSTQGGTFWNAANLNLTLLRTASDLFASTTVGSGNYTVPAGIYKLRIRGWGGGGGGTWAVSSTEKGNGGGGGGFFELLLSVTPGQVVSYVVGGGGAAAGPGGGGGNGGTTSCSGATATGGAGAPATETPAAGGVGSGAGFTMPGQQGGPPVAGSRGGGAWCIPTGHPLPSTAMPAQGGAGAPNSGTGGAAGGSGMIIITNAC